MSDELVRKEWLIQDKRYSVDVTVPYYVHKGLAETLEGITPHNRITQSFPDDFAQRGALLPFAVLCASREYAGLDQTGYETLAGLLQDKIRVPEAIFSQWDIVRSLADKQDQRSMLTRRTNGETEVYFPTVAWAVGNR